MCVCGGGRERVGGADWMGVGRGRGRRRGRRDKRRGKNEDNNYDITCIIVEPDPSPPVCVHSHTSIPDSPAHRN